MARFEYVCEKCGNVVPAERIERRVPGSKSMARVMAEVVCEHDGEPMPRREAVAKRREVGREPW